MKDYQLRPATQNDALGIQKLVRMERLNPIGLTWKRFIVAISSAGELIGCGQVKPHRQIAGSTALELASIVVKPTYRGRGIARALIEHLLDLHGPPLYLTCRASLGPFYERFGFRRANSNLPAYFQLARLFIGILRRLGVANEELLVMRYGDPADEGPSIEDR